MAGNNVFRHLNDLPKSHGTVASQSSSDSNNGNNKNNQNRRVGNYVRKKPTKILSLMHIADGAFNFAFGLTFFIVGTTSTSAYDIYGDFGLPAVVIGIFLIVNGVIGYLSSKNSRSTVLNRCNMAMSILTCVFTLANIFLFSIMTELLSICSIYLDPSGIDAQCRQKNFGIAMTSLLLLVNVVDFFIGLASSIYACLFYDCCLTCCRGDIEENDENEGGHAFVEEHYREETNIRQQYINYGSYQNANYFLGQNSNLNENGTEQSRDIENSIRLEVENGITEEYVIINNATDS